MLALTLEEARAIAALTVVALVALALASAWFLSAVAQKVAVAVILGLLALLVWTQRAALQECADKVRAGARFDDPGVDTTCSFLGRDIEIKRSSDS